MKRSIRNVEASDLGRYVGSRLMTKWTASLLVYGAEESEDYDFEDSFYGSIDECIDALRDFQEVIDRNGIDGYLTLESDNSEYYEGDYDYIMDCLSDDGII